MADSAALGERVKVLQEELAGLIGDRSDRTLFVLTVVTLLALPFNVVGGLFGMDVASILLPRTRKLWIVVRPGDHLDRGGGRSALANTISTPPAAAASGPADQDARPGGDGGWAGPAPRWRPGIARKKTSVLSITPLKRLAPRPLAVSGMSEPV